MVLLQLKRYQCCTSFVQMNGPRSHVVGLFQKDRCQFRCHLICVRMVFDCFLLFLFNCVLFNFFFVICFVVCFVLTYFVLV